MKNSKHFNNIILIFTFFTLLISSHLLVRNLNKPLLFVSKQQSTINFDQNIWTYFHLGQKRFFSSLLWISTILESDHEHYKTKDLNSWMFLRFHSISLLEPKFYEAYNFGAQYLSIIKDDITGASVLYNKGLTQYPKDYKLLKNAAFHYYFEAQDYDEAYKVLSTIKTLPKVNKIVLASLARIESQNGNLEDALKILEDIYADLKVKDHFMGIKISEQIYSIKAELDLNCLNGKKLNCSSIDAFGNDYLKDYKNNYYAKKEWIPFRIKKK